MIKFSKKIIDWIGKYGYDNLINTNSDYGDIITTDVFYEDDENGLICCNPIIIVYPKKIDLTDIKSLFTSACDTSGQPLLNCTTDEFFEQYGGKYLLDKDFDNCVRIPDEIELEIELMMENKAGNKNG